MTTKIKLPSSGETVEIRDVEDLSLQELERLGFRKVEVPHETDDRDCLHENCFEKTFNQDEAKGMTSHEVRQLWPRFYGTCLKCGFSGIAYQSYAHYVCGDW